MDVVIGREDADLLGAFYRDVYLPAFAHQREPLEAWLAQQTAERPSYSQTIVIAGEALRDPRARRIDAGVIYERYPRSACGLITYLVVAPHARRGGLGARLLARARDDLRARGARLVLGEVHDPAHAPDADAARARIAWFAKQGARVVDVRYVQPDLGAGLGRDRHLKMIAFSEVVDGAALRAFLAEFYDVVEGAGASADAEVAAMIAAIPDDVRVI
jgi:GNAT superfamily N-acetyltransferase